MILRVDFKDINQQDDILITVDKFSKEVIFSKEKEDLKGLLWVKVYSDGFADFGYTEYCDRLHGNKPYTWSSNSKAINRELELTDFAVTECGAKEYSKDYGCYIARAILKKNALLLAESNQDKLNYSIESFKHKI